MFDCQGSSSEEMHLAINTVLAINGVLVFVGVGLQEAIVKSQAIELQKI